MMGKNWPKPPPPLAPCARGKKIEISVATPILIALRIAIITILIIMRWII